MPDPVGAVRLRLVTLDDPADPRATAYADLRGAIICDLVGAARRAEVLGRLGPDPLRPDADPDLAWRRISASPRADRRPADGPEGPRRRRQRLPRRGALPAPHPPAAPRQHAAHAASGGRCGPTSSSSWPRACAPAGSTPSAPSTRPRRWVGRRARTTTGARSTSTGVRRMPCLVCGTTVRTGELAGRNSFWCPECQPKFRSRAVRSPTQGVWESRRGSSTRSPSAAGASRVNRLVPRASRTLVLLVVATLLIGARHLAVPPTTSRWSACWCRWCCRAWCSARASCRGSCVFVLLVLALVVPTQDDHRPHRRSPWSSSSASGSWCCCRPSAARASAWPASRAR